jgi:putative DNA primase/helicase
MRSAHTEAPEVEEVASPGLADAIEAAASIEQEVEPIPAERRPCYRVYSKPWQFRDRLEEGALPPGLWWHGVKRSKRGEDEELIDRRIGRPAWKLATSETAEEGHYGLVVEILDLSGRRRVVTVDRGDLIGDGRAALAHLERCGAGIVDDRLYLGWLRQGPPERRVVTVRRVGWTDDFRSFVLPDRTLGDGVAVFADQGARRGDFKKEGEFVPWREAAALAAGNPLMMVTISAAFAAPLLGPLGLPSCGLHIVGPSGLGKTTAALVAASAWGRGVEVGGYFRTWSATVNGIEALAVERCDAPLVLDEIGAGTGAREEVEALIYRLAGGVGRARARRDGTAQHVRTWRTVVLSTGEVGLEDRLAASLPPGAKGRFLELRLGAGSLIRELNGFATVADLVRWVRGATARHYGHAGPMFVERALGLGPDELKKRYREVRLRFEARTPVEDRAANTFALLALAGELAREFDIVAWPPGAAVEAALEAWTLWRGTVGVEADEPRRAAEMLADFLARHGDARFSEVGAGREVRDRAGWWRVAKAGSPDAGAREWLFTAAGLNEALRGLPRERAIEGLIKLGIIVPPASGPHRAHALSIDGRRVRVYLVRDFPLFEFGGSSGSSGSTDATHCSTTEIPGRTVEPPTPDRWFQSGSKWFRGAVHPRGGTTWNHHGTTAVARVVPGSATSKPLSDRDFSSLEPLEPLEPPICIGGETNTSERGGGDLLDELADALDLGELDKARRLFERAIGREPVGRELGDLAMRGSRELIRAELEARARAVPA